MLEIIEKEKEMKIANKKINRIKNENSNDLGSNGNGKLKRVLVNKLNDLEAKEWIPETISVYVQKGLGAGHKDAKIEKLHPAPFSFQDVARLIRFFTKKNQIVLDPFCGVGSTLKACALLNRDGIGIELSKKYCDLTKKRLESEVPSDLFKETNQKIINGDSLKKIDTLEDNSVDFVVTSPPYWNILDKIDHKAKQERLNNQLDTKYSNEKNDLANIANYPDFIEKLSEAFEKCKRVLKSEKYICIIVSDFRHKSKYFMFHSDLANNLEKRGFVLKGIKVLYQRHKKVFPYGYPYSYVPNIHHQYILVMQNVKKK